jgi:hypothetical protein
MGNDYYYISSAESIEKEIRNHSHYGPCLNGSRYSTFCEKSNELSKCKNYRKEVYELKEDIIKEFNDLKTKEKEKNQSEELFEKECQALIEKNENEEKIETEENEKKLKMKDEEFKTKKEKGKNKLEELETDIKNLREIIITLKENKADEIEKRKEEILNKLEHEYELKIYKYEMEKEYQKIEIEERIKVKQKDIQRRKRLEFAELKNKSELVNKLIYCFKINNFMINN